MSAARVASAEGPNVQIFRPPGFRRLQPAEAACELRASHPLGEAGRDSGTAAERVSMTKDPGPIRAPIYSSSEARSESTGKLLGRG